jgi:hypothetical protein
MPRKTLPKPRKNCEPATSDAATSAGVLKESGMYETPMQHRLRLLREYPEYCTAIDVGRMLDITPRGVRHHKDRIKHIEIEGITLYHRVAAKAFAHTFIKTDSAASRFMVVGIEVERLQKICETYYRSHYDDGPPELLALAKRVAGL